MPPEKVLHVVDGEQMRDQQIPVLFRGSRYADRLPIGTLESLETFDPEALRRFLKANGYPPPG